MKTTFSLSLLLVAPLMAQSGLTIYNQGIAVVREVVPLDLQAGVTGVTFDQATAQVRPDSVVLRDPAGKIDFSILEQGYRNDPVSQDLLLSHFEGKTIGFQVTNSEGVSSVLEGEIVRSGYVPGGRRQSPIIKVDGMLQFELPGMPLFPALGDDSILKPSLSWQIDSAAAAKVEAQLSYISGGFSWEATYNVVAPEKGETVALNGWVTLSNTSGTKFTDATVKLVAGEVNVQRPEPAMSADAFSNGRLSARMSKAEVTEKSFDDFHLYGLPRPLTLRDQETKQVEFLNSGKVQAKKKYVYAPFRQRFYGGWNHNPMQQEYAKDVLTFWEFKNSKENGLGVPFPAGTVRFYRSDEADGNLEFVGENRIDHTPKNEVISVQTGTAFDLLGERKNTNFEKQTSGLDWVRESFEITLTNRSEEEKVIVVREPMWRWSNWKIEKNSMEFEKVDAQTIEFEVEVPADGKTVVSYTVHYFEK
ncbi:MAG: DUF4139 domain-containing protein [Verrucomicrobiaceae bacterium]